MPSAPGFSVLVISAGLLAPVGVLLGRLAGDRLGRWIAGFGSAAATVHVIGLSRWVLLIPGVSADAMVPARTSAAHRTFELLHTWLGRNLGETIGYALTATFTALVVPAVTRHIAPPWMAHLGDAAAALIATGVVVPLGVEIARLTNFVSYVMWCLWLIAMGVALWRAGPASRTTSLSQPATVTGTL